MFVFLIDSPLSLEFVPPSTPSFSFAKLGLSLLSVVQNSALSSCLFYFYSSVQYNKVSPDYLVLVNFNLSVRDP